MCDPILVTLLKIQPHYSQSSRENATPSSGTSPVASYKKEPLPPPPGDNNEVDVNDTLKILGVTLDRRLNFVAHVSEQVKKACAKASALRMIRRFIPLDVMCRLYKAYILSHLEYCSPQLLGVGRG